MMKRAGCVIACAAALAVASAAYAQDRIRAVVNNEIITQKDLEGFTTFTRMQLSQKLEGQALEDKLASMKDDLLERLIEDRLILQEARKSDVKVDDSRVKAKMLEVKSRYATEKEFAEALMLQGLTEADVESRIRDQMMMYALVDGKIREKIEVTPGEITDYYTQHAPQMTAPERRELVSLSADKEETARELAAELRRGKDMDALAAEKGLKPNNFSATQGELKKDVDEAVFGIKSGEVAGPVKVNGSFYVFQLKTVVPPRQLTLTEVQDQVTAVLFEKKMQEAVAAWLEEQKKKAYIRIME